MNRRAFLATASTEVKREWGSMEIISKVPASEEHDRTCGEKGHV